MMLLASRSFYSHISMQIVPIYMPSNSSNLKPSSCQKVRLGYAMCTESPDHPSKSPSLNRHHPLVFLSLVPSHHHHRPP